VNNSCYTKQNFAAITFIAKAEKTFRLPALFCYFGDTIMLNSLRRSNKVFQRQAILFPSFLSVIAKA
jgi:hypothetical protein